MPGSQRRIELCPRVFMLPPMRPKRLVIPLVVLSTLAFAAPAMAADATVGVFDFEFDAKQVEVGVGETVTWNFVAAGHTTTSDRGQPDRWDSGTTPEPSGESYQHTFDTPGRYSYYCRPHLAFMKGTVVVGTDEHKKSYSSFRKSRRGKKITFKFTLVEAAKVNIKLSGADDRSATRKRLRPGRHSIVFKRLDAGSYRAKATFTDDFDKKSVVKTVVR
jgi:plastocyanin